MGCLSATYRRIGSMTATLERVGGCLSCFAERIPEGCLGSFDLSFDDSFQLYYTPVFDFSFDLSFPIPYIWMQGCAEMVQSGLACTAERTGGCLEASATLVCSTSMTQYLRVEPEYVWLVPEWNYTADTEVISNVEWNVT